MTDRFGSHRLQWCDGFSAGDLSCSRNVNKQRQHLHIVVAVPALCQKIFLISA